MRHVATFAERFKLKKTRRLRLHVVCRLKECGSRLGIYCLPDTPIPVGPAARLLFRGKPEVDAENTRFSKVRKITDRRSIGEGSQRFEPPGGAFNRGSIFSARAILSMLP